MSRDRGFELIEQAEKKLKAWFGKSKYEEASDLYVRAASSFRIEKNYMEVGACLGKAAECEYKLKNMSDAARLYSEAGMSLKKVDIDKAEELLRKSIEIFDDEGKLMFAGKSMKNLAEVLEEANRLETAMECFEMAANYFMGEDNTSHAVQCSVKVGDLAASTKDYDKAVETFEETAKTALGNHLLKFSAKDYLFKAGLCMLCLGDETNSKLSIEKYADMDNSFRDTREEQLLLAIVDTMEDGDVEEFTNAVRTFDKVAKLDDWKTNVLLDIKKVVEGEESVQ